MTEMQNFFKESKFNFFDNKCMQIFNPVIFHGEGLQWFVKEIKNRPYVYNEHVLPHDAEARELGTGKTRVETLYDLGLTNIRVVERQALEDGIHACRMVLPMVWFDMKNCARGIEALTNYQRKWDEKNKIFSNKPLHNWASHGADAFRTFALGRDEHNGSMSARRQRLFNLPEKAESSYDVFNYRG